MSRLMWTTVSSWIQSNGLQRRSEETTDGFYACWTCRIYEGLGEELYGGVETGRETVGVTPPPHRFLRYSVAVSEGSRQSEGRKQWDYQLHPEPLRRTGSELYVGQGWDGLRSCSESCVARWFRFFQR